MSEMADDAAGESMDLEDMRELWREGLITAEEAYELGIIDELGIEIR